MSVVIEFIEQRILNQLIAVQTRLKIRFWLRPLPSFFVSLFFASLPSSSSLSLVSFLVSFFCLSLLHSLSLFVSFCLSLSLSVLFLSSFIFLSLAPFLFSFRPRPVDGMEGQTRDKISPYLQKKEKQGKGTADHILSVSDWFLPLLLLLWFCHSFSPYFS